MKKRRAKPSSQSDENFLSGDHLTDGALLLLLDGELPTPRSAFADQHIQSCWSCRARRDEIARGIVDLVDYQKALSAPYLPPPADHRNIFLARLAVLADEIGRPSPIEQWADLWIRLFTRGPSNQFAWLTAILLCFAVGSAFYAFHAPRSVSANEVMKAMDAAEIRSLQTARQPVMVQRLHIRSGKSDTTRTVYLDVLRDRTAARDESGNAELKVAYQNSSLDWNAPLDAASYRHWRATHRVISDKVLQLDNGTLVIESKPATGPITSIDLTIRKSDYHAIEEDFRFEDHTEIEVAELSYEVVPFSSLSSEIFGSSDKAVRRQQRVLAVPRSALPNSALVAAQVEADATLHRLGADLGEQINVTIHPGHEVLIDGVVADEDAKLRLIAALGAIPHTKLNIVTTEEVAEQAVTSTSHTTQASASPVRVMVATPPLLETQLNERFPDKDRQIAYVNETLSLVQSASSRAWALNRLANRYPIQQLAQLDEDSRQKLKVLLVDHVSAMREDISSLQNQLGEILSRSSNTPASNTAPFPSAESSSPSSDIAPDDWQDRSRRVHSSTEAIHEAVVALITSSQPSEKNDTEAIEINLRTSLTQIQTELLTLDEKLRRSDLK